MSLHPIFGVTPVSPLPAPDFISDEQTVAFDTLLAVAHGLGSIPSLVQVSLRCKTAEDSYVVGDEIPVYQMQHSTNQNIGLGVFLDTTNVSIIQGQAITYFDSVTLDIATLTVGNWRWIVRAWR